MTNFLELIAVLGLLIVAIVSPRAGRSALRRARTWFRRLAARRWRAIAIVAATALVIEIAVGIFAGIPAPAIHDEFAYLLAGDTFAGGRLTNPPHRLAEFFETDHVIHWPTYQAKYPPAQGMLLAMGQAVFGQPIVGVWLSVAMACGAVCWMLQGWMRPHWAILGGLLAAFSYGVLVSWGQSCWGGAAAMIGGAMVFGALPRIMQQPRIGRALALGGGLAILANSRPYEGLLVGVAAAWILGGWLLRGGRPRWQTVFTRLALPTAGVLAIAGAWMAVYNDRVTGDPFRLPYQQWRQNVSGDDSLGHEIFGGAAAADWTARGDSLRQRWTDLRNRQSVLSKALLQWSFYGSPALVPALLILPWTLGGRWPRRYAATFSLVLVAILLEGCSGHTHYSAPVTPLFFGLVVQGYRRLRVWRWQGRPTGRLFAAVLPALYAVSTVAALATEWSAAPFPFGHDWSLQRANVVRQLSADDDRHLVIVRYGPDHVKHQQWVYNAAEIDAAKIVWAHDRGDAENRRLIDYFANRQVWLVEPDQQPLRVARYSAAEPTAEHASYVFERRPNPAGDTTHR